jgi:ATP-dependent Clp endopeptidase proteolytic subunit ClpP
MNKIGDKAFWSGVEALKASTSGNSPKVDLKEVKAESNEDGSVDLYIDDAINGFYGLDASTVVKAIHESKGKAITMHVNSPGGSVFDGLSIYNAMQDHEGDINVKVTGLAASIASIIALGGSNKPEMATGTRFMIHNASVFAGGDHRALRETANLVESITGDLVKIYENATGLSSQELTDYMDDETFFSAEDAVAKGFATMSSKEKPQNTDTTDSVRAEVLRNLTNCQLQAIK